MTYIHRELRFCQYKLNLFQEEKKFQGISSERDYNTSHPTKFASDSKDN